MKKSPRPPGAKRPGAVIVAGWIAILGIPFILIRTAWLFLNGQLGTIEASQAFDPVVWGSTEGLNTLLLATSALIALLSLIAGIAILRLKRWAWVMLIVVLGVGLAVNILRYFYRVPEFGLMLVYAAMALILNQGEVRRAFRIGRPIDEAVE